MKLDVVTETLSNLQIAERQLDRAIWLFFFEKDFVSALTLAGAAEEILGKLLKIEKKRSHALESLINGALILNGVPSGHADEAKSRKELSNMVNYFKNRLKHYNDEGSLTFSVDYYAAEVIDRASTNYFLYTGNETKLMEKFKIEVLLGGNV